MRRLLSVVFAVAAITASAACSASASKGQRAPASAARPGAALAPAVPAGLPSHFGIGVSAEPDSTGLYGWMPHTRIPFDYAYQYLAAGVNTGNGWQTWNDNSTFPLNYAKGAASHGYVPFFSYYMLLQSNGPCANCVEAQKDLSHLNSGSLMAAYYADFAKLMERLGPGTYDGVQGYGQTAVVQVEPDLSGYAEQAVLRGGNCYGFCTAEDNDPSSLKASVAGSGFAHVAGYPNTYRGFNLALLHLRDLYAPNVLLAFHISDWALVDIGSDTHPNLHAGALGHEVAHFAERAGVTNAPNGTSTYDVLTNDVADRDAGYYKYVLHQDVFWDRKNVAFPNFHRWETYLGAISLDTGKGILVWQIRLGNQYFRTENNTVGHYQDNRIEYFLLHVPELVHAGVIGLLFGAGNGGSTVNYDGKKDGVTNPPSFCSTDGTSGSPVCNDHSSKVADDDGGYLRMMARRYYRNPVPLG